MAEVQVIYQVWCDVCQGQVYRSFDQDGANQALAMHEDTHAKAAECDHPQEARAYGAGEAPTETCTQCGYSFPMHPVEEPAPPMLTAELDQGA